MRSNSFFQKMCVVFVILAVFGSLLSLFVDLPFFFSEILPLVTMGAFFVWGSVMTGGAAKHVIGAGNEWPLALVLVFITGVITWMIGLVLFSVLTVYLPTAVVSASVYSALSLLAVSLISALLVRNS